MIRRLLNDSLVFGSARIGSAGLSLLLFALIARYLPTEGAKTVFFFAFALGFVIAGARTYMNLSASLTGRQRRAAKLARTLRVVGELPAVQLGAGGLAVLLLTAHPLPPWLLLTSGAIVALVVFDSDLVRASLNRGPSFAVAFAAGSALAVGVVALSPTKSTELGCVAILVAWLPTALLNLYFSVRLLRRRAQWPRPDVSILMAAYFDGLILNAPYLLGSHMDAATGLELSIATRIFVASLPLLPLVLHWSNTVTLSSLAFRLRLPERRLYFALVAGVGSAGGAAFSALFALLADKPVTWNQYLMSVLLLISFAHYSATLRFGAGATDLRSKLVILSSVFAGFVLIGTVILRFLPSSAALIVALQAAALWAVSLLLQRAQGSPRTLAPLGAHRP